MFTSEFIVSTKPKFYVEIRSNYTIKNISAMFLKVSKSKAFFISRKYGGDIFMGFQKIKNVFGILGNSNNFIVHFDWLVYNIFQVKKQS